MPNWVENHVYLKGDPEQIQTLLERVKNDEYGLGTIDFNKIIPMPESLSIESGSRTIDGLKAYRDFILVFTLCGTINLDKVLDPPQQSEELFLEQRKDIEPDVFKLGKQAYQNQMLYGAKDWYDWCNMNWNTKWNACGYEPGQDYSKGEYLWFQTAWDQPEPILVTLSEMFPEVEITHEWANEDFSMGSGQITYRAGEAISEYYPTEDAELREFALSVWGFDDQDNMMEMEDLT